MQGKSRGLRKAIAVSALALVLCVGALTGATFAWFTDTVTNTGNMIVAGELAVDLIHVGGGADGGDVSIKEDPDHKIFNYEQWEPGYTVMETLKVVNEGSLALKFRLDAVATGADTTEDGAHTLADAIDVWVFEGDGTPAPGSFAEITAADSGWRNAGALSALMADEDGMAYGVLLPEGATASQDNEAVGSVQMTVALHMQEAAGNEYQGLSLGDLCFTLQAVQYAFEEDGFGDDQYDEIADYALTATAEEFEAALDDPEVTKIAVTADLTFDWGNQSYDDSNALKLRNKVISGVTGSEVLTFAGYGSANPIKDVTLNNITVKDETVGDVETAWEHGYLEFENLTAVNVTFLDQPMLSGDCSLTDCTLNGTENQYAVWVNAGNITLKNCTLDGLRMLKIHEAYGSEVESVVVDGCTFTGTVLKAGIDFGTLNADTAVTIKNCTFTNCKGIYEGDTPVENFIYVAENNTEA